MKIKFADKTVEVKDIYYFEDCMTEDALQSYGYYEEEFDQIDSDSSDAKGIFEVLRVRELAFAKIEAFSRETGLHSRDAFVVAYRGINEAKWQEQDHEIADELDLIETNFRRWRAVSEFGRMGGSTITEKTRKASRENGRLGGRPRIAKPATNKQ